MLPKVSNYYLWGNNMIKGVTFEKILKKLKEKNISRYRLVDAKRDTKSYDEYYRDDPLRFSNSPFKSIMKGEDDFLGQSDKVYLS